MIERKHVDHYLQVTNEECWLIVKVHKTPINPIHSIQVEVVEVVRGRVIAFLNWPIEHIRSRFWHLTNDWKVVKDYGFIRPEIKGE